MNNSMNRFEYNPAGIQITRSRMRMTPTHQTTFNAGDLIPFKWIECLPGDTVSLNTSAVCRLQTPIFPIMDNAYLDTYYFFIPTRLVWEHTKEFYGENTEGPWAQTVEYHVPNLRIHRNAKGSIYDQLQYPLIYKSTDPDEIRGGNFGTNVYDGHIEANALIVRAYGLVWNEWFRDQNVSAPLVIPTGDDIVDVNASIGNMYSWISSPAYDITTQWMEFGMPLPVAKFHDLFTSALPQPQKGPAVTLPLGGDVPVVAGAAPHPTGGHIIFSNGNYDQQTLGLDAGYLFADGNGPGVPSESTYINSTNLVAPLTSTLSVNDLRMMLALQRLYEKDARGGTRFRELILSHFGVRTADSRVQVPEFLSGNRVPIQITSVPQTSSTDSVSPQGNLAAYSITTSKNSDFTYSCTEPGFILGVCCVRTDQRYCQGLRRQLSRTDRFSYYWPVFANVGEQPIKNKELYIYTDAETREETFGFGEAWYEYRFEPNTVAGALRPNAPRSLAAWNFANGFTALPTLHPNFIYENKSNVDRTLAIPSNIEDQFLVDFYFDQTMVRPMPLYSIPGIGDHF